MCNNWKCNLIAYELNIFNFILFDPTNNIYIFILLFPSNVVDSSARRPLPFSSFFYKILWHWLSSSIMVLLFLLKCLSITFSADIYILFRFLESLHLLFSPLIIIYMLSCSFLFERLYIFVSFVPSLAVLFLILSLCCVSNILFSDFL